MEKIRSLKFARTLRKEQTSAEHKLWGALRKRSLAGHRFNRQVTLGPYLVDSLCREKALVVEVDGATHGEANEIQYDAARTRYLNTRGYAVFRVTNLDVYENLTGVLDGIQLALEQQESKFRRKAPLRPSATSPSKAEGG